MIEPRIRRRSRAALVMAVLLVAAACSNGGSDEARSTSSAGDVATEGAESGAGAARQVPDGEPVGAERQVVYSGWLTVRVDDVEAAAAAASTVAREADGYLAGQQVELTGVREARVTVRVPSGSFEDVMVEVAALGAVRDRRVGSEDVTDDVVDLEERLTNARASAERLRELLASAENLQNVIAIEDRLTQRETEIESLAGQLQVLDDRTAFATIEVTFVERDEPTVSDDLPGPLDALRSGVVALANVLLVVSAAVAFSLPFLPFVGGGWYVARRVRRARAVRRLPPPPASD